MNAQMDVRGVSLFANHQVLVHMLKNLNLLAVDNFYHGGRIAHSGDTRTKPAKIIQFFPT